MIKRADRAIIDINSYINPTDFYADDSEKIKINWMCFKYATYIFRNIDDSLIKKLFKKGIKDNDVSKFCIQYSKSMKKDILRMIADEPIDILRGEKIIKEYFPTIRKNLVDAIYFATAYAWDQFFSECGTTIIDCISDINGKTYLFDDPKYNN